MLIPNEALITFEVAWAGASKVTPDLTSCQPPCPLVRVEFHKYRLPVPPGQSEARYIRLEPPLAWGDHAQPARVGALRALGDDKAEACLNHAAYCVPTAAKGELSGHVDRQRGRAR